MNILFVGNSNNEPMRLAHEFAMRGHEVVLVCTSQRRLDDPQELLDIGYFADSRVRVVRQWAALTQWDWMRLPFLKMRGLRELMAWAEVVVLNSIAVSVPQLREKPYAVLMTGADLTVYCDPRFASTLEVRGRRPFLQALLSGRSTVKVASDFVERQSRGVAEAGLLLAFPPGVSATTDAVLSSIGAQSVARLPWRSYTPVDFAVRQPSREAPKPIRVLIGSRIEWPTRSSRQNGTDIWSSSDTEDKGTKNVLLGFQLALHQGLQGELYAFEKGSGVAAARELAQTLGVATSVHWLKETSLRNFLGQINAADAVIDSIGASPPGRVSIEALAMNKPLVSRIGASEQVARFGAVFSSLRSADSPQSLCEMLLSVQESTRLRCPVGDDHSLVEALLSPRASAEPILASIQQWV